MIPLDKLEHCPRSLKLRKITKIFGEAEYRVSLGIDLSAEMYGYLLHILELLASDPGFDPGMTRALNDACQTLQTALPLQRQDLSRVLNRIRHLLLRETGRSPADWDFIDYTGRLDPQKRHCFPGMQVYLEDIRSPFNVGAMFRTAESFGVETIFLSPWCADPHHPRSARTAMGCVSLMAWERLPPESGLRTPLVEGPCFALETGGTGLGDFTFPLQGTLIVGCEELGVSPQALAAADASLGRVSIPTYGTKGSLNASVAFGIALQSWAAALAQVHCRPSPASIPPKNEEPVRT
ncbi:MAG: TrmH family RNA methyltransferase [Treponema sp.]|jgi:TrmH family RNA methyltransferase|nr:TrmH family RNA methyltransferase [Treponema sp.]